MAHLVDSANNTYRIEAPSKQIAQIAADQIERDHPTQEELDDVFCGKVIITGVWRRAGTASRPDNS